MKKSVDIGLPALPDEIIERLAEECEQEATSFIMKRLPSKSIEHMSVTCLLSMNDQLDFEIGFDIALHYDMGISLDSLLEECAEHVTTILEQRLKGLKDQ